MTTNDPHDSQSGAAGAKEQARQTAGTATDEARNVAGTAASEARQIADEARSHVSGLLDQATSQVDDQARTQRDRLVDVLGSVGDDLHSMSSQSEGGIAADLTQEAASRIQTLTQHLDGREPRELLDDVRDFARRRPGTFLVGALVAGVVVGRLTRGARDAQKRDDASSGANKPPAPSTARPASTNAQPSVPTPQAAPIGVPPAPTAVPAGLSEELPDDTGPHYASGVGTTDPVSPYPSELRP